MKQPWQQSFRLSGNFLFAISLAGLFVWQLAALGIAQEDQPAAASANENEQTNEGLKLFRDHVRPAFVQHCLECHGGKETKADFDLATRESLMEGGFVELGNSANSWLLQVITHEQEPYMPYKAAKLPEETIASIARWIDLGAPYDKPLVEASSAAQGPAPVQTSATGEGENVEPGKPSPASPQHAEQMKAGLQLFSAKVRPVLLQNCVKCHGGESTKADFDMTTRESLLKSGVVDLANGAKSRLMLAITHAQEPHMPYKAGKLQDEAIADIARWISLGAPYDKPLIEKSGPTADSVAVAITDAERAFWSFQPLRLVAPPAVQRSDWVRTPIDQFILAQLEQHGAQPSPPAERRKLIRRAYFDLLGLPPTPDEVASFVADPDPAAYEKLIDRLLASPHYGERWARHWMDVARFAESHGYEQDYDRPHAYPYRDFLIKAFNADLPFDEFVRWQIAGDELAPGDPLAMCATGFLGAGPFPTQLTEAEFESARYDELDDMVRATTSAFLGLTVGCARCHDHKFDPIPAEDYYSLAAAFTTTIRSEIDLSLSPGESPTKVMVTSEGFPPMKHHADDRGFPHFYQETYSLDRGLVSQKKHLATPGYLRVLMRPGQEAAHWQVAPPDGSARTSFRRAALAQWITDVNDGAGQLTARVIVNRLWHFHFGRGIVATPNDFGFQGERPTHPELLDWLATDLIHNGWRLKRLQKLIMTSSVYMQSSGWNETSAQADRENRLLWRWQPRRLEGEAIRDAMLSVSQLLDPAMYGPGSLDSEVRRRSVYFFIKRSQLIPMMVLFDWPEHLQSVGARNSTTIAPQALAFLNSREVRKYAEGFADRLKGLSRGDAIQRGYSIALGRQPTAQEQSLSAAFLAAQTDRYRKDQPANAERLALVDLCQALLSMSEFVYLD